MRMLKTILWSVLALIVLVLTIAAFVSGNVQYERSVIIHAPVKVVWNEVSTLSAINNWNPWINEDPNMKTTIRGIDGKPDAAFCWSSENKSIGSGCEIITFVSVMERIELHIQFSSLLLKEAKSYIKVQSLADGKSTKVSLGFTGEIPYPIKFINLFARIGTSIDKNFTKGLNDLTMICEQKQQSINNGNDNLERF